MRLSDSRSCPNIGNKWTSTFIAMRDVDRAPHSVDMRKMTQNVNIVINETRAPKPNCVDIHPKLMVCYCCILWNDAKFIIHTFVPIYELMLNVEWNDPISHILHIYSLVEGMLQFYDSFCIACLAAKFEYDWHIWTTSNASMTIVLGILEQLRHVRRTMRKSGLPWMECEQLSKKSERIKVIK